MVESPDVVSDSGVVEVVSSGVVSSVVDSDVGGLLIRSTINYFNVLSPMYMPSRPLGALMLNVPSP